MDEDDLKKQYDLIFNTISSKLEKQVSSLSSIDTKVSIILASIGVIFAGYLQLISSEKLNLLNYPLITMIILIMFIISGFFAFKSFTLKRDETWRDDPRPSKLLKIFSEKSKEGEYWLKDEISKSMSQSYEENDKRIISKYEYLHKAKNFLFFGVIGLFIHVFISVFLC